MRIGKLKKAGITLLSLFMVIGLFTSNVKTIEAVDSNDTTKSVEEDNNITVNMFDYNIGKNKYGELHDSLYGKLDERITKTGDNQGINSNHYFKFTDENYMGGMNECNIWTGDEGKPYYGIVKNELYDGFPVLSTNNQSLDYLFNDSKFDGKTEVVKNVQGLLTKTGSNYTFDSDKQYAELDGSNISLKQVIDKGGNIGKIGVFSPFDKKSDVEDKSPSLYSSGYAFGPNVVNHYFGMTLETDFIQPKGGMLNEEDPMVFEFSGDDDVWVFVDNKLVLDLGGIHNKVTGSINFKTGWVIVYKNAVKNPRNIDKDYSYNMFTGQKFGDYYNGQYDMNLKIFDQEDDFYDYSKHSLKFFYLERGNGASNCKLDFNLVTIPAGSVIVSKEVIDEGNNAVNYSNTDYDFQILKQDTNNNMVPLESANYNVYKNNTFVRSGTTNSEGVFNLKHDEYAIFEDSFLDNDTYQVTEIGAYLDGYNIEANVSTEVLDDNDGVLKSGKTTGPLQVSEISTVNFKNKIIDTTTLTIQKTINANSTNLLGNQEFNIRLKINDIAFNGSYVLNEIETKWTNDGSITLKKDDIVTISGLPFGSSFEVIEEDSEEYTPTYIVTGNVYDVPQENRAYGKVYGKTATVNIENAINSQRKTSVTVNKIWQDGNNSNRPTSINVQLYKNGAKKEAKSINASDGWECTFDALDYYSLVNGQYIINTYTVNEVNVNDNYISEVSNNGNDWTITNTLKTSLKINKQIDNYNASTGDPIFTFKITNVDDSSEYYYKTVRLDTSKSGSVEISGLKYGSRYKVEELDTIRYKACNAKYENSDNNDDYTRQEITLDKDSNCVDFYNKRIYNNNFSDTDVVINKFTVGKDGKVTINKELIIEDSESEVD